MPDQRKTEDAVFRIFIRAEIQRVWRELTKHGEAQGAIFNAWLHSTGALGAGMPMQMRTGSGSVLPSARPDRLRGPARYAPRGHFIQSLMRRASASRLMP